MAATIDVKVQYPLGGDLSECIIYDESREFDAFIPTFIVDEMLELFKQPRREKFFMQILKPQEGEMTLAPIAIYDHDLGW